MYVGVEACDKLLADLEAAGSDDLKQIEALGDGVAALLRLERRGQAKVEASEPRPHRAPESIRRWSELVPPVVGVSVKVMSFERPRSHNLYNDDEV